MKSDRRYGISAVLTVVLMTVCACAPAKETVNEVPKPAILNTTAPEPEKTAIPEQTSFTLLCRTEEGAPVPGTGVDICSGSVCRKMKAGEDGMITFYGMPGESYDVTPAEAPEGYVFVSDRALIADKADMKFEFILKEK